MCIVCHACTLQVVRSLDVFAGHHYSRCSSCLFMLPKELKYAENVLVSMFLKLSSVLPTTMQCLGSLGGFKRFVANCRDLCRVIRSVLKFFFTRG